MFAFGLGLVESKRAPGLDHVADFGRHDEIRALVARAADKIGRRGDIGLDLRAGGQLHTGGLENLAHAPRPSSASSLPARSSAASSSEPPTCLPSMKICGTVWRPPERATISSRLAVSAMTSISA